MKTKFIKILVVFSFIVVGTSCDNFIDVVPDNLAKIEDAFKTRDSAERFLATLYSYMPPMASINNPALTAGDEIAVNERVSRNWGGRIINRGGQNITTPELGYWGNNGTIRNLFIALRDCNIFLENLDKPFDLEDFEEKRWTAEAKFLKAYYHFYLMRMYGPIPIVRENIEVSSGVEATRVNRDPVDDVVNYIIELLDEAIADLPSVLPDPVGESGRITAQAAYALKARVLVTAASPLFNGNEDYSTFTGVNGEQLINTSYDESKWTRALEACKEAIEVAEANGHRLYEFTNAPESWSDSTITKLSIRGSLTDPWNEEIIWGSSQSPVTQLQNWAQAKIAPGLTALGGISAQSWWGPPLHIAEMFYSENGVPIEEDKNYDYANRYDTEVADSDHRHYLKVGFETSKLNFHREPRFYASLGFDGGLWMGHGVADDDDALHLESKRGDQGGRENELDWALGGYWAKKIVYYENVQASTINRYTRTEYPFPMIRLADLYLLYAEALNEASGPGEAIQWIDRVRIRAGLNGVVESWNIHSKNPSKPSTKEGLREIIQQERMIELAFEGRRFWDLRRWKRASEFLNKDVQGWNSLGKTTEDYYKVVTLGKYKFLRRDYLWPISEQDIIRNSNLVQNPGW
ncbi:RagB/SusD family nutrient uptake outer membrane protein [Fulvivirgaceae bacterium BMA10]|uniref:RagB/SusD family nutrient uptake outer membrane protein n=1 Tax=Splendidivirga corallicola TaxID=3051826 RepID=A0ABT8KWD2_9BACT|nr:RagB/SusD family nutrient uptake outer membrane protein [Fulvivirgaceae bacterium BMA10]